MLGVWTGDTPAGLTIVKEGTDPVTNDDKCAGGPDNMGSQVTFTASAGTTYRVEVAGFAADQGLFYLRAYAGGPQPSVEPDTIIGHGGSFAGKLLDAGPVQSGPRQTASFDFTSDEAGASFQCSFDGSPFSACTSPVSLDGVRGTHSFSVRSVALGVPDPTPAEQIYTIDHDLPDTTLVSGPPSMNTDIDIATRSLGSERSSTDAFRCGLDSQQSRLSCESRQKYFSLCRGMHTFHTAFVDSAGNLDPTPATTTFMETGGLDCAAPSMTRVTPSAFSPTAEDLDIPITPPGAGADASFDWGTTTAYGQHFDQTIDPDNNSASVVLQFLQPDTTYHYRVTLTTPFGSDTTGDQTFTTETLGADDIPAVSLGTPVLVGHHAVAIPIKAQPGDLTTEFGVLLDNRGPVSTNSSPAFEPVDGALIGAGGSAVKSVVDVVDLQPGTYHARGFAFEENPDQDSAVGPDIIFTVPAEGGSSSSAPPPPLPPLGRFKLRAGLIKLGKIGHRTKTISLVLRHLPPSSAVSVTVRVQTTAAKVRLLARGHAKAGKGGVARLKVKLSPKGRRVLRSRLTRSLSLNVRVKPPGQSASSIALHRRLKR